MSLALNVGNRWECSDDKLWAMNLRRSNFVAQGDKCDRRGGNQTLSSLCCCVSPYLVINDLHFFTKQFSENFSNLLFTFVPVVLKIVSFFHNRFTLRFQDNPPQENCPPDNCPLENCPSGNCPPGRTITSQTISTQENRPLDNSPGQLQLRTIVLPPDNYTWTITALSNENCKLQLFHGYFLFLLLSAQVYNF